MLEPLLPTGRKPGRPLRRAAQAQAANTTTVLDAAVLAFLILLGELLVVFKMRDGANWARIVLTVLTVLQLIGFVIGLANIGEAGVLTLLLDAVVAILNVAVLVLMYRPECNRYFTRAD